ncbi:DUF1572 family protein [Poritiphilus flavus]|uniref:DUF1572 domain-containing protein n=1 Tax=Poritiphilus flavus TaxID=2697053 RepID=A0A6L9EBV3_9FLAO|nr:DUF1572 family protein [Poritiphilus flavus]NAS12051.1 DUF1572 domain-containing protein [Poritiphilus flavus]
MNYTSDFLSSLLSEFKRYKALGDKTFAQLSEEDIRLRQGEEDNSIAVIVKHISGNMLSRWTNFLTEDGEKTWRNRETEFEDSFQSKSDMISAWERGWDCLFEALKSVNNENFDTKVYIRGEAHSIPQAFHRQLGHYAYHIGQIVFLGKMIKGSEWVSLSIPKGGSEAFNKRMFGKK